MTELYNKKVLKIVIAQTCQTIGWHSIQTSPMDIMIDILDKYLKELTTLCHNNAELCNRTEPNLNDLALAFRSMDININDIDEYINYVQPITCPVAVPQFPLKKTTNLNFLKPGRKEVLTRPVFVYEYLPPIFSDKEDSEHETNELKPINALNEIDSTENFNLRTTEQQLSDDNETNIHAVDNSNNINIENNPDSEAPMELSNLDKNEKEDLMDGESSQIEKNSGAENLKDNLELQISNKIAFEKPATDTSIQKCPIDAPAWPALDAAPPIIDSSIRDISSVLMTSSGFISPCRVGKLPESRPPILKERRRSITPPHQIPEQTKPNISKTGHHVNKSNSVKRSNDSDSQLDMHLSLQTLVSGKLPKVQDLNERLKKMKNKILVSAHQPNQLKKSLKQRKRNKLVSKNLASSVQAHKLLKQQMKLQQNSLKLLDKTDLEKTNLELQNIDMFKGNIQRLKSLGKSTALQIKKKEKKSKKLQQKELSLEKQASKKMQEQLLKQILQSQDQTQILQEIQQHNRVGLTGKPQDQMKPSKVMSQKQIDLLQKQLQKNGSSYLNKLDVFKKKASKQDHGTQEEIKARNQLASTNPHLIQLPFGTTITSTGNSNRNLDQQYSTDPESQIICLKDDEGHQSQQKDQKSSNDTKHSVDRNGNVLSHSQSNSLAFIPQLNDKISQQKLQKKLKRKAKQLLNSLEEPLNLSCIDPSMSQTNPNAFLKNLHQKNLEWLSKNMDKEKAQKFSGGSSMDMEKLIKKERKNKKLKNAANLNQIDMASNRSLQNYPEQQQLMYAAAVAAAAASNQELDSSNLDNTTPINKGLLKMDTILKSQANSGAIFNKSQRKKLSPDSSAQQQLHQDQQQQNAAIVLNAASNNPFLAAAAGIDGIFKQFPYPGFPTGPGLIPQALFGPSGSFIPPGKPFGLGPAPGSAHTQISGNSVFNRFSFPTLSPMQSSNIGREIHREQESPLSEQQSGKYCNIAPLIPDSVIRNIKGSSSRQSDSDYGNQNSNSIDGSEKVKNISPMEEDQLQPIEISDDENKKSDEEEEDVDKFSNPDKQSRKSVLQGAQNLKNWSGNLINIESPPEDNLQTEDCSIEDSENTSQTPMSEGFQGSVEKEYQPIDGNQIKESSAVMPKVKHRKEHHHQHHHKKDKYKDKMSSPNVNNPEVHQKPRKSKKDKKTKSKEKLEKKLREKAEKGANRMIGSDIDDSTPRKLKLDKLQKKLQKKEKRKEKQQQKELLLKREQQQEAIMKLPGNLVDSKSAYSDNFVLPLKTNFENVNENINLQSSTLISDKGHELSPELARISPLVTRPQKSQQQSAKSKGSKQQPETDSISKKPQANTQGSTQPPITVNTQQQAGSSESSSSSCSGGTIRGPGRPKGSGNKSIEARPTPEPPKPISAGSSTGQPKKPNEQSDEVNVVWICPACGRVDDGTPMIGCDGCDAWYHWVCVGIQVPPDENENWYCRVCIAKKQETHEVDKKKKKKNKKNKSLNIKVNLSQN